MSSNSGRNPDKKSSQPLLKQATLSKYFKPENSGTTNSGNGSGPSNDRREPSPPSSSRNAPSSSSSPSTRSQSEKKPPGFRQSSRGRYQARRSSPSTKLSRDELREIADTTLTVLDEGAYLPPGYDEPYDLLERMYCTNGDTAYYPPDDEEIAGWVAVDFPTRQTRIIVKEYSTLVGARKLHEYVYSTHDMETATVGVLNFASAKKPGGGFLSGSQAQEESIARVSTLYYSLLSEPAKPFYDLYQQDPDNHMYTHAMVYSPGVVLMRDDRGEWLPPVEVDILTSAAVNAGDVRKQVEWQVKMRDVRARYRVFQENEAKARKAEEAQRQKEGKQHLERLSNAGSAARARAAEEHRLAEAGGNGEDFEMGDATDPASIPLPPSPPSTSTELGVEEDPASTTSAKPVMNSPTSKRPLSTEIHPDAAPPEEKPLSFKELLAQTEKEIEDEMKERIARLLYLFYIRGAQHLVLGSFGTGVFQNKVEMVARIFYDLLAVPGGKFHGVFDTLVFAILGPDTVKVFRQVFADVVVQDLEGEEADDETTTEETAGNSKDTPTDGTSQTLEVTPISVDSDTEGAPLIQHVDPKEQFIPNTTPEMLQHNNES
ncbi:hypothetical protein D9619_011686 [Psilocybe cf. subviscida]|uniref:Microbial-type PARG catalytic domain-containing protein n=1 Tax=Psilocybe cf. subviscida TaxID=2480587 RepID=A0A8H5BSN8_9AGAR|nr:hypothetical protein D9619_011686 [Psilocybe cf. subviscida]